MQDISTLKPQIYGSYFKTYLDYLPYAEGFTQWEDMVAWLSSPDRRLLTLKKESQTLISFAKFDGKGRKTHNVEYVTAVVVDLDNGTSLEDVLKIVGSYEFFSYSTHRHDSTATRQRLIFPLLRLIKSEEYIPIWKIINDLLGGTADSNAKDPTRLSFLPSCPPDKAAIAFCHHQKGSFLNPDELPTVKNITQDFSSFLDSLKKSPPDMHRGYPDGERTEELTKRIGWCLGPHKMNEEQTLSACLAWNQNNLPPLPEKKIHDTVKSIFKKSMLQPKNSSNSKSDHLTLARNVIDQVGTNKLLATASHIWMWDNGGVWNPIDERVLEQRIHNHMESEGLSIKRGTVKAVSATIQTEIFSSQHEWDQGNDIINFKNGELIWTGNSWQIQKHNRSNFCTTQIPHTYDVNAKCPRFYQFLCEVFEGDSDMEDKILLILELLGYTLVANTKMETFVILVGSGANGKSVLLDLIRMLVGDKNVAAVQPAAFNNSFQRAHLHNKLANLVTELGEGKEIADAELKAIASGELTTAEHKYGHPFNFRPYCTCWFGTNHLPHTRDFSNALFRRAKIIQFNRTFVYGQNADPNLKSKLVSEIPGIIHLALWAYGEVLKRNSFTEPSSCAKAKHEWRIDVDQAAQFITEMCELVPGSIITSQEFYAAYKRWAENMGITKHLSQKSLTQRATQLGCKPSKGTNGIRIIAGIRFNYGVSGMSGG